MQYIHVVCMYKKLQIINISSADDPQLVKTKPLSHFDFFTKYYKELGCDFQTHLYQVKLFKISLQTVNP